MKTEIDASFSQFTLLSFLDGYPLLCGGQTSLTESLSSCFVYIPSNDSWIQTGSMNDPKGGSAYGKLPLHTEHVNMQALLQIHLCIL